MSNSTRKIWGIVFLIFLPALLFSQSRWSFAGSASGGISEADNPYMANYKDSKGKIGMDLSIALRYSLFWKVYASSGVGFQAFKSESGLEMKSMVVDYKNTHPQFSYSNIYIPVSIGLNYDRWRVYPLAEAGVMFGFPIEIKDRVVTGNEVTTLYSDNKPVNIAYFVQAGAGFTINTRYSLEAKFRFSNTTNTSDYVSITGSKYKSTWMFLGGQVSFVVKI